MDFYDVLLAWADAHPDQRPVVEELLRRAADCELVEIWMAVDFENILAALAQGLSAEDLMLTAHEWGVDVPEAEH